MNEKGYTGELYRDEGGDFRWRLRAVNGRIVADSGEGYELKSHAIEMFEKLHPDHDLIDRTSE